MLIFQEQLALWYSKSGIDDSRAIMVKGDKAIPLSIDQKPDDPEESKRIKENGGEISQYEEDGEKSGPFRVWQKGEVYPGIAMSRSIGGGNPRT